MMTEITIHIPTRLQAFLAERVQEGFESVENYLLTLVEEEQMQEARTNDILDGMSAHQASNLDAVLRDREKGPFESVDPFDEGYWAGIKNEGLKQARASGKV
jgi:Arc/MetJ-type ribon-helix-helix transcriptional regulator